MRRVLLHRGFPEKAIIAIPDYHELWQRFIEQAIVLPEFNDKPEPSKTKIRTVVFTNPLVEAVMILWPPNSMSSKHDHGFRMKDDHYSGSYGVTFVLWGTVFERKNGTAAYFAAGQTLTEDPRTEHVVGSHEGAFTLHIYCPPLTGRMTVIE